MASNRCVAAVSAWIVAALAGSAQAGPGDPVYLQWWENRWREMEHRTPDFFMAGYGALWLPPIHKGASAGSVGYDVWDRFDLGRPGSETAYGTESDFRAVVAELHDANALVNIDIIMNHQAGRTTAYSFHAAGGYPGFWTGPLPAVGQAKRADANWGDFHNGSGCCTFLQSENPGGANYNLLNGDLVALTDIAQETNHQFIRHPIVAGDPQNIPAGTVYNLPDPANRRCYPDRQLTPMVVNNPGTTRNPGALQFTFFPFNTADPMQGDPIADNGTGLLMRWTQWTLDEFKVDGFRIDAIKHTPSWFFDQYWDSAVHQRRATPWGQMVTPYSFGESVESNAFTLGNYVRKDAFGNRDALDLNGAGQLRDLISAGGFGSWSNVLSAHLDNQDDGFNNGSVGVNHVFSHDNGSAGNGGSAPPDPTYRQQGWMTHAYLLMRTGPAIVYHNARGVSRPGGFWPRQGVPIALGLDPIANAANATLTTLVHLHNWYGRGEFNVLNGSGAALNDVLVFERRKNQGGGNYSANVLVGVSDRYDAGYDERTVTTSFPQGTILREMTGNATDAVVDPTSVIFDTITVGAGGSATIRVPRNLTGTTEHNKGFVVYGPAVPAGVVSVTPIASIIAPDDPINTPPAFRRTTAVPVVSAPTFELRLVTTQAQTSPADPNTDDKAAFRIDQGFRDLNGNGIVDYPASDPTIAGYEDFLTLNQPLYNSGNPNGDYRQTINTALLAEGYHYISVVAFRHRPAGTDPLFREFRQVIYVDRAGPAVQWIDAGQTITSNSFNFRVRFLDRTANQMHLFWDLPPGTNPVPLCTPATAGQRHDRFEWRKTLTPLGHGLHSLTVVAFEDSGNSSVTRYESVFVDICYADFDKSGGLNINDFVAFLNAFAAGDPRANCDGSTTPPTLNVNDFVCFQNSYIVGCP
ncbi:MAG: hypothetical protein JNM80_11075 [Phycisphaerae bacterium]|nr:hypothetical protein [Phycisphaerae bacterium]